MEGIRLVKGIKAFRKSKSYAQTQSAQEIDISLSSFRGMERGKRVLTNTTKEKILLGLGVTLDELQSPRNVLH